MITPPTTQMIAACMMVLITALLIHHFQRHKGDRSDVNGVKGAGGMHIEVPQSAADTFDDISPESPRRRKRLREQLGQRIESVREEARAVREQVREEARAVREQARAVRERAKEWAKHSAEIAHRLSERARYVVTKRRSSFLASTRPLSPSAYLSWGVG